MEISVNRDKHIISQELDNKMSVFGVCLYMDLAKALETNIHNKHAY